jgi:hypothetical protein
MGELTRFAVARTRRRRGEPEQVPDFIALRGDPWDKVLGASGVGARRSFPGRVWAVGEDLALSPIRPTAGPIHWSERAEVLGDLLRNPPSGGVNWLKVAIARLGGPAEAARVLGVQRQAVYLWLKQGNTGVRGLTYRAVERIAKLSRIPVDLIGSCGSENETEPESEAKKPTGKRRLRSVKRDSGH